MWTITLFILMLWLAIVWIVFRLLHIRQPGERVKFSFEHPIPQRANVIVTFKGEADIGPFSARATLLRGQGLVLTRDSVDGEPDGDNPLELTAAMLPAPIGGENVHRIMGKIGIESLTAAIDGRIRIEVMNAFGTPVAAQVYDF